jgi:hypothetical protein
MYSLITLVDFMLADRRCGCRGGEVATNMQRRKIPYLHGVKGDLTHGNPA